MRGLLYRGVGHGRKPKGGDITGQAVYSMFQPGRNGGGCQFDAACKPNVQSFLREKNDGGSHQDQQHSSKEAWIHSLEWLVEHDWYQGDDEEH